MGERRVTVIITLVIDPFTGRHQGPEHHVPDSLESSNQTFFAFEAAELSELESSELDPESDEDDATPAHITCLI